VKKNKKTDGGGAEQRPLKVFHPLFCAMAMPLLAACKSFWRGLSSEATNKKCLHGLMAALKFCGGKAVAAMPLFSCAPCSAQAPPATPVRLRGRALTHEYC